MWRNKKLDAQAFAKVWEAGQKYNSTDRAYSAYEHIKYELSFDGAASFEVPVPEYSNDKILNGMLVCSYALDNLYETMTNEEKRRIAEMLCIIYGGNEDGNG